MGEGDGGCITSCPPDTQKLTISQLMQRRQCIVQISPCIQNSLKLPHKKKKHVFIYQTICSRFIFSRLISFTQFSFFHRRGMAEKLFSLDRRKSAKLVMLALAYTVLLVFSFMDPRLTC
jgi:hypothetical protein